MRTATWKVESLDLSPRPDRPIEIDWSPSPKAASHPWAFARAVSVNVKSALVHAVTSLQEVGHHRSPWHPEAVMR